MYFETKILQTRFHIDNIYRRNDGGSNGGISSKAVAKDVRNLVECICEATHGVVTEVCRDLEISSCCSISRNSKERQRGRIRTFVANCRIAVQLNIGEFRHTVFIVLVQLGS